MFKYQTSANVKRQTVVRTLTDVKTLADVKTSTDVKTLIDDSTAKIQRQKTCKFLLPPKFFSLEKNYPNPEIQDNPHGHQ